MLDVASGGVIISKTPREICELISVMAANSQQFGAKTESTTRHVNEVNLRSSDPRIDDITGLLQQTATLMNRMVASQYQPPRKAQVCGICGVQEDHPIDACPSLLEDNVAEANALGGYAQNNWRKYDPYSNTYNPGWMDHPNLRYGNNHNSGQNSSQPQYAPRPDKPQRLEEIIKNLAMTTQQLTASTHNF